jgi:hypothetical protein
MRKLNSNADLQDYARSLCELLANRGANELAESVRNAATLPATTGGEYLGECLIAFKGVMATENGSLGTQDRDQLRVVIGQIEASLGLRTAPR